MGKYFDIRGWGVFDIRGRRGSTLGLLSSLGKPKPMRRPILSAERGIGLDHDHSATSYWRLLKNLNETTSIDDHKMHLAKNM